MASWGDFLKERRLNPVVHVVYAADETGALKLDPKLEAALVTASAKVTRGVRVDAVSPPDLIILEREAATGTNLEDAITAALRYSREIPLVIVAADAPSEVSIPAAPEHEVHFFPPFAGVTYISISRRDYEPLLELQNALESYTAWAQAGRHPPMPIFFPGRPRANENFRALAERAPIKPTRAAAWATAVTRDLFQSPKEIEHALDLMLRAFRGGTPRELISTSMGSEADVSDLFRSDPDPQWSEDPPETEDAPSRELVKKFDTPMPVGVRIERRVNYYEFDIQRVEEVDPVTGEKERVEIRENCRPVMGNTLRAIEALDPAEWTAHTGGIPLVSAAAIARYEADPKALGTELENVHDGEQIFERVILDQTHHWSGMFGYAPASNLYPLPDGFTRAFANVEIDDETGEIRLLRPIADGEYLTIDYGEDFFGESSYPHFALEGIESIPESKDEELELLDVMMSHAWDAVEAERLNMDLSFIRHAAQIVLVTKEELTGLAFGLCADVIPVPPERVELMRQAAARIFASVETTKEKILGEFVDKFNQIQEKQPGEAEAEELIKRLGEDTIKSLDPERLWEIARDEWTKLSSYLESTRDTDPILYTQLEQLIAVLDDEAARVMHPRYDPLIAYTPPRLGIDFVLPYTFDAMLRTAQGIKRTQLEEWRKLIRDADVDPDKRIDWDEAKRLASQWDTHVAAVPDPHERKELLKYAEFWRGYTEFTVVDPKSHARELVFSTDELLKIREKERQEQLQRREKAEEEKRHEETRKESETEEAEERRRIRRAQEEERVKRREKERIEFNRLGRFMLELIVERSEGTKGRGEIFDTLSYASVAELIIRLEGQYSRLVTKEWNKRQRERWENWKGLARDAYERSATGDYKTTGRYPKFVEDSIIILTKFEEYENNKHPHQARKALERLGEAQPEKKRRKKKKKKKKGTGIKKSISPAKAGEIVQFVARPGSAGSTSYSGVSVFRAANALIPRTKGDAVFFFYGTRDEGIVEQFGAVYKDATILFKPGPGHSGGIVSPDEVRTPVTFFFVLYGGDEDARRWYQRMPRGTAWPYLITTREIQGEIDSEARRITSMPAFEMQVGGEKIERFEMFRRVEIVVLEEEEEEEE